MNRTLLRGPAVLGIAVLPSHSPTHVSSDFYYRIPVLRQIYKQYPVYVPGKEPAGYTDALKAREPQKNTFDFDSFKGDAEWNRS